MTLPIWKISSKKRGEAYWQAHYILRTPASNVSHRADLLASGSGNLPAWANGDPFIFFHMADQFERANGCAARALILTLPKGHSVRSWVNQVERYVAQDLPGKPFLYGIHAGHGGDPDSNNPHVHILYSDRVPDAHERGPELFFRRHNSYTPELGGCRKDSGGKSLLQMRIEISKRKAVWSSLQSN